VRFDKRAIHEFNLSQFQGLEALHTAFHLVRDASIKGNLPLIFWDEFDSDKFSWLRYFLAPMQDAEFRVGSVSHPFGKAIFIFAGGVKESFQELDATKTESDMKERKLPDFISRLRGFVNIKGPNRSECVKPEKGSDQQPATTACEDSYDEYLIRRAILLRSILERTRSHLISPARTALISPPLVTAFLRTKRYHHGARSLEALVAMSNLAKAPVFSESCLPSEDLMHLHLDVADFKSNLRENSLRMHEIEIIAEACHSAWCAEKSAQGYAYGKERQDLGPYKTHPLLKHYSELDEMGKEGNRLTARLTLAKLHQAGLKLIRATPGPGGDQAPDASHAGCRQAPADLDRETMACIEHDIWLRDHLMGGYTFCKKTDDDLRLHRNVAKFEALNNTDRRLDLVIVESLESALKVRGYTLSKNQVG